jgi:hypothetical protein
MTDPTDDIAEFKRLQMRMLELLQHSAEPKILHQGYIIELADGGPWLTQDLTWTPNYDDRGVWRELADAELARARSLEK